MPTININMINIHNMKLRGIHIKLGGININMKRNSKTAAKMMSIAVVLFLCIAGFLVLTLIQDRKSANVADTLSLQRLHGDFAINTDDLREVVGFSDYFFIAKVAEVMDTEYRNPKVIESENGTRTVSTPYTNYRLTVVQNIKGDLPADSLVAAAKFGGVSSDGSFITIFEEDELMDLGQYYAIAACVQEDGSLLISGPNSNRKTNQGENGEWYPEDNGDLPFSWYYAQEVPYERERFASMYD